MAAATSRELRSSPTAATTSDMLGDNSRSSTSVRTTATNWSHCSLIWASSPALPGARSRAAARWRSRTFATPASASSALAAAASAATLSRPSVTPLMAETTTAGPEPSRVRAVRAISMRRRMASGSATDVPPNFCTTIGCRWPRGDGGKPLFIARAAASCRAATCAVATVGLSTSRALPRCEGVNRRGRGAGMLVAT